MPPDRVSTDAITTRERALADGRAAYAQRQWSAATEGLGRADAISPLDLRDLDRLVWSMLLVGRDQDGLALLERLHHAALESGDRDGAAQAAFWCGFRSVSLGETMRAAGWLARAARLAEGRDCVVRGYLLVPKTYQLLAVGDDVAAETAASQAVAIGERFGDADLVALARNMEGRARIRQGKTDSGLALLDEVMVSVMADEVSPVITGVVYCSVIATCQQAYAVDRSRQWTEALAAWCDRQPDLRPFRGACMVHRAEIMELSGDFSGAIVEAQRASEVTSAVTDPQVLGDAFYQQGEIHRLRAEQSAAEAAYRRASEVGRDPQPGLALLRLAQGRGELAQAAIQRALASTPEPLRRTRLLPAAVEIHLAREHSTAARAAANELAEIAARYDLALLGAMAAHATGAVQLAEGDASGACERLRRAFEVWRDAGMPYIAARIRVTMGRACQLLGDEDGAQFEWSAARQVFEHLAAHADLASLNAFDHPRQTARSHGLSPREVEVLRLVATGRTNKIIAKELCLSDKTIDRHLSNIFTKLGISSRAAATAYAYEHGLV